MPILEFSFSGGSNSKQGADFLKTLFFNMFIADPSQAVQDVLEINFGFEVTSIAGMAVNNTSNDGKSGENKSEDGHSSDKSEELKETTVEGNI